MKKITNKQLFIIVTVLFLLCILGCDKTEILSGLEEKQANQVLVALGSNGISAKKTGLANKTGISIIVESSNSDKALSILSNLNLPKNEPNGINEMYAETGIIPTPSEERARFTKAVSGELEKSLLTIERVVDAKVHIVLPDPFSKKIYNSLVSSTASVLVKYIKGKDGEIPISEENVKKLIAGGVEGLKPENVSVITVKSSFNKFNSEPESFKSSTFFGIKVDSAGIFKLKMIFGSLSLLVLILAILLVYIILKKRDIKN